MLIAGEARGTVLALDEPLSFWGGFDAETGTVIDRAHPCSTRLAATRRVYPCFSPVSSARADHLRAPSGSRFN